MPRDTLPLDCEVSLPGRRTARVCPADDAGEVRFVIQDDLPVDRLLRFGAITRDEHDAARRLHELFENAGIRPRVTGSYEGMPSGGDGNACRLLEKLTEREMAAWRQLGKMLLLVPVRDRTQISLVACWGQSPTDLPALRRGLTQLSRRLRRTP